MRRRAFLATALTATSTITAGCGSLGPQTKHTDPIVETDANPRDRAKYLIFRTNGSDLAHVGVDPNMHPRRRNLGISIWHADGTELRSLTQRFTTPDGGGRPPEFALQGPLQGGHRPHPSVSLFREERAAVLEVHRFGELADETAFIGLNVTRWPESAHRLVVDSAVKLVGGDAVDRTHVLTGELEFDLSTETATIDGSTDTSESPG